MIYFKEYIDYEFNSAVKALNRDLATTKDNLIATHYQIVKYESKNYDRAYILTQWSKQEEEEC